MFCGVAHISLVTFPCYDPGGDSQRDSPCDEVILKIVFLGRNSTSYPIQVNIVHDLILRPTQLRG